MSISECYSVWARVAIRNIKRISLIIKTGDPELLNYFCVGEYKKMAGNEFVGFSNATFLSEKSCADQNFAIGYFLKEHGVFPPGM